VTYVATSLIALLLYFVELSLLPHFSPWLTVPFLLLPFIAIISAKDRTIFPIILGGISGLLMDATTLNRLPVFAITFIVITAISKIFFARFISYGELRATLVLTLIGLILVYSLEIPALLSHFTLTYGWIVPIVFNILATYLVLIIMLYAFRKYFDWVEKTTEGRFR